MDWYTLAEEITIVSEFYSIKKDITTREYNCTIHVRGNVPVEKRYEIIVRRFETFRKNLTNVFISKVKERGYVPKNEKGQELNISTIFKVHLESHERKILSERENETLANFCIELNAADPAELPTANIAMLETLKQLEFDRM